ncbi:MAG: hypothetical protein ACMV0F_03440 [Trichlorobacter sp.]
MDFYRACAARGNISVIAQMFLFVSPCQRLVNITLLQRNHDAYYKVLGMLIERQYPEWVLVRAPAGWLAVLTGRWGV